MRFSSSLLVLVLFSVEASFAQTGQEQWEYIPAVSTEDMKLVSTHGIGTDGRYVITWIGGNTEGKPVRFDVYERAGLQHVKTVNAKWPANDHYIERWVDWNAGTYLITVDNDAKAGRVDIKAQRYTMPELIAEGEPLLIGSLAVTGFNTTFWGLGLRFERSPDGERMLMLFDRLIDGDGKQLAACWVFDTSWSLVQKASIELKATSDEATGTRAALVDDEGIVHLLVSAKYDVPGEKSGELGHRVFRIEGGSVSSQTLAAPTNAVVTSAGMERKGDELVVGGFYQLEDKTGGYFHASLPADLGAAPEFELGPLADRTKKITRAQLISRGDGGFFLIGNACRPTGLDLEQHQELSVVAYGASGVREWDHTIPRAIALSRRDNNGFIAVEDGGSLILLMPDAPENVINYREGKPPASAKYQTKTLLVRFDGPGKPTFKVFGAPAYTMLYQGISLLPDGHTVFQHAAPTDSKMDRNQAYAFVDLRE